MLYDALDYTVQLPAFEGPLDLLLRLIEREELDITAIALAQVADAYLAHVRALDQPDPAALSAFLVIAAKLVLIKSRALLPRPAAQRTSDEALDTADDLVRQLHEYKRYKQAAGFLRQWQDQGYRSYTRQSAPPLPAFEQPVRLDVSLGDMIAAVQRRMQLLLPLNAPDVPLPKPKVITVPEMAIRVRSALERQAWIDFE